ncbi:Conserved_hypothetical protein [Hexamita inflata]|uniref:Uncharacterized protein n=1 Tax=Hexamita inflata TaxID=28002 RepID=A0AA86TXS6_9EUKA|nr:Conserved hypothetical protein [Hexamita inflata]
MFSELPHPTQNQQQNRRLPDFAIQLTQLPDDIEYVNHAGAIEQRKLKSVYQPNPMRYFAPQKRGEKDQFFHVQPYDEENIIKFQQSQENINIDTMLNAINIITDKRIQQRQLLEKLQRNQLNAPKEVIKINNQITIPSYEDQTQRMIQEIQQDPTQPRMQFQQNMADIQQAVMPSSQMQSVGFMQRGTEQEATDASFKNYLLNQFQVVASEYKQKLVDQKVVTDVKQKIQIDSSQILVDPISNINLNIGKFQVMQGMGQQQAKTDTQFINNNNQMTPFQQQQLQQQQLQQQQALQQQQYQQQQYQQQQYQQQQYQQQQYQQQLQQQQQNQFQNYQNQQSYNNQTLQPQQLNPFNNTHQDNFDIPDVNLELDVNLDNDVQFIPQNPQKPPLSPDIAVASLVNSNANFKQPQNVNVSDTFSINSQVAPVQKVVERKSSPQKEEPAVKKAPAKAPEKTAKEAEQDYIKKVLAGADSDSDDFDLSIKPATQKKVATIANTVNEAKKTIKKKKVAKQEEKPEMNSSISDSFISKLGKQNFKQKAQKVVKDSDIFSDD